MKRSLCLIALFSACTGSPGPQGEVGMPCASVTNGDGSYTITCPDSEPITVRDGAVGEQGPAGANGEACAAADNGDGTYTISCPDSEPVTVRDGADGEACEVTDNGDGSYTVTCPDSDPITIRNGEDGNNGENGQNGENGENGADGADGDDCTAQDNGDGTLTIRCGDQEPVVVRLPRCGDGVVAGGEECDDANLSNSDACTILCLHARCGDGVRRQDLGEGDEGYEACDDGNDSNEDNCTNACQLPRCGDGFVFIDEIFPEFSEACDDGNDSNTDACTNECVDAVCGDGLVQVGEEACDEGGGNSDVAPDTCRRDCTLPGCGDGVVDQGEECDDGNDAEDDQCLNDCSSRCVEPAPGVFPQASHAGQDYVMINVAVSYDEARTSCENFCGHLLVVNDQAEYNFYQGMMAQNGAGGIWLGFTPTDGNGAHTWVNGDPVTFTFYCNYPGGNGCANPPHPPRPGLCTTSSQFWYPTPCENDHWFICELP